MENILKSTKFINLSLKSDAPSSPLKTLNKNYDSPQKSSNELNTEITESSSGTELKVMAWLF